MSIVKGIGTMGFDLLFFARGEVRLNTEILNAWFNADPKYTISNGQAVYENNDTGVHFIFEFSGENYFDDEPAPDLVLYLNFIRPTPFAAEAADEVDKLVKKYGLRVQDPQESQDSPVDWSRETFISSYIDHAERAFGAVWASAEISLEQREAWEDLALPRSDLWRIWEWNAARQTRYDWLERQGRNLFIPIVSHIAIGEAIYETFVWADGLPAIIPPTRHILLSRREFAWRRGINFRSPRQTIELVPFSSIKPVLQMHYDPFEAVPGALIAQGDTVPTEIKRALSGRTPGKDALNRYFYADEQQNGTEEDRMTRIWFSDFLDQEFFD